MNPLDAEIWSLLKRRASLIEALGTAPDDDTVYEIVSTIEHQIDPRLHELGLDTGKPRSIH